MRAVRTLIAVILVYSAVACAQEDTWEKVRYNGGTFQTSVDPHDWNNRIIITSERITFYLKDGQGTVIPAKNVTALSYGQEAHRHIGTLGIMVAPVGLFGLLHKARLHFIGIDYTTIRGTKDALLLQADKGNYRAILTALVSSTNLPVSVSEEDRPFVPRTAKTVIVNDPEEPQSRAAAKTGMLSVSSSPSGAQVYVDGELTGNTPCKLTVPAGKHKVKLTAKDHKDWTRELTVREGSETSVNGAMKK